MPSSSLKKKANPLVIHWRIFSLGRARRLPKGAQPQGGHFVRGHPPLPQAGSAPAAVRGNWPPPCPLPKAIPGPFHRLVHSPGSLLKQAPGYKRWASGRERPSPQHRLSLPSAVRLARQMAAGTALPPCPSHLTLRRRKGLEMAAPGTK